MGRLQLSRRVVLYGYTLAVVGLHALTPFQFAVSQELGVAAQYAREMAKYRAAVGDGSQPLTEIAKHRSAHRERLAALLNQAVAKPLENNTTEELVLLASIAAQLENHATAVRLCDLGLDREGSNQRLVQLAIYSHLALGEIGAAHRRVALLTGVDGAQNVPTAMDIQFSNAYLARGDRLSARRHMERFLTYLTTSIKHNPQIAQLLPSVINQYRRLAADDGREFMAQAARIIREEIKGEVERQESNGKPIDMSGAATLCSLYGGQTLFADVAGSTMLSDTFIEWLEVSDRLAESPGMSNPAKDQWNDALLTTLLKYSCALRDRDRLKSLIDGMEGFDDNEGQRRSLLSHRDFAHVLKIIQIRQRHLESLGKSMDLKILATEKASRPLGLGARPTVLVFWSPTVPNAAESLLAIWRCVSEFSGVQFVVVGVYGPLTANNVADAEGLREPTDTKRHMRLAPNVEVLFVSAAIDSPFVSQFSVSVIPQTVVIDACGLLRECIVGMDPVRISVLRRSLRDLESAGKMQAPGYTPRPGENRTSWQRRVTQPISARKVRCRRLINRS